MSACRNFVAETNAAIANAERANPQLNAFITMTPDRALRQAKRLQDMPNDLRQRLSLAGVFIGIKDFFDTAGTRTTAAFEHYAERVPSKDAAIVEQLEQAGAIILGKTNMHRLGMGTTSLDSHFGPVRHPLNSAFVTGGSSGGSASAVRAGLVQATIDTDAVGSCRLPAAVCGVVGFKPSFGRLSGEGILAGEEADGTILLLNHVSVTASTVEDCNAIYAATVKSPPVSDLNLANQRLGIVANHKHTPATQAVFEKALEAMFGVFNLIEHVNVPFERARFDIRTIETDRTQSDALLFSDCDLLLLPTLTDETPTIEEAQARGEMAVSPDNTFFANYFGLPAITVPSGIDRRGMPQGLQIVGKHGDDKLALAVAARIAGIGRQFNS
jgi:aspartyl-tRNA(Asn)/glutamyl-tRNA(Gln) amidotransferase subunit A